MYIEKKGIPPLIAVRLQKYAFALSIYDFDIQYRKGKLLIEADFLSRLPLPKKSNIQVGEELDVKAVREEFNLDFKLVAVETAKDSYLNRLLKFTRHGWNLNNIDKKYKYFFNNNASISLIENCILFNNRVVIPDSLKLSVLELLHSSHINVVQMKRMARKFVYWQNLDKDIDLFVETCEACCKTSNNKKKVFSSWPIASEPFERVHLDFFYFQGKRFLIFVDSYSKWIEVKQMRKTDAKSLIRILCSIFSCFGKVKSFVTDNGPPYDSYGFENFCKQKNIELIHSPAYHPESNGRAERAVQTVKKYLKKMLLDPKNRNIELDEGLEAILFDLRTKHCDDSGKSPSEKLFKFVPRKKIDDVLPQKLQKQNLRYNKSNKSNKSKDNNSENKIENYGYNKIKKENFNCNNGTSQQFTKGDKVWFKRGQYRPIEAKIVKRNSNVTYYVELNDRAIKFAHINQLKIRKIRNDWFKKYDNTDRILIKCNNNWNIDNTIEKTLIDKKFVKLKDRKYLRKSFEHLRKSKRNKRIPERLNYSRFS